MFKPLKLQPQQKLYAYVVCWYVLEAFPANSLDPNQEQSDLGPLCLSLYLDLLNTSGKNCSRRL